MTAIDDRKERFGELADAGDGAFAVAYALLLLADQQAATVRALHYLGTGNAGTSMGAIEFLGAQVEKAGDAIASALGTAAEHLGSER